MSMSTSTSTRKLYAAPNNVADVVNAAAACLVAAGRVKRMMPKFANLRMR